MCPSLLGGDFSPVVRLLFVAVFAAADPTRFRSSPPDMMERVLQTAVNCTQSCCQQYSSAICPSVVAAKKTSPLDAIPIAVQILLIIFLLALSASFAGLILGFLSLDKTGLEIVMEGDDRVNAARAKRIYPIRERGNLLLCTLVLGNVAVNALLSILLADRAGGLFGFFISTILITVFAEILPQALCSRFALAIANASVPLVRVFIVVLFPIAFPMSWILDRALGQEIATTYSTSEMAKLLQIHVSANALDPETGTLDGD
jgi:hypothetical protein